MQTAEIRKRKSSTTTVFFSIFRGTKISKTKFEPEERCGLLKICAVSDVPVVTLRPTPHASSSSQRVRRLKQVPLVFPDTAQAVAAKNSRPVSFYARRQHDQFTVRHQIAITCFRYIVVVPHCRRKRLQHCQSLQRILVSPQRGSCTKT